MGFEEWGRHVRRCGVKERGEKRGRVAMDGLNGRIREGVLELRSSHIICTRVVANTVIY